MDPATVVTTIGAALKLIEISIKLVHEIGEISAKARKHKNLVASFANRIAETGERLKRQESSYNQRPPEQILPSSEIPAKLKKLKGLLEESKLLVKELESASLLTITKAPERIRELQEQIESIRLDMVEDMVHDMQSPAEERAHLSLQLHYGNQVKLKLQPQFLQGPSYLRSIMFYAAGNSNRWGIRLSLPYRISWRKK